MIAMKILKAVLDTWGYRELFMWNKKITSYDEIQKFDVKKQRWASRTDTRTFKNEFAVSELVENELGPLGRWNYSETIFILNTVELRTHSSKSWTFRARKSYPYASHSHLEHTGVRLHNESRTPLTQMCSRMVWHAF